jgi:hypothetical protein
MKMLGNKRAKHREKQLVAGVNRTSFSNFCNTSLSGDNSV